MKREKKRRGCVGVAVLAILLVSTDGISQFVESAETQRDLVFAVSERGAHHKVWERIEYETRPDGKKVPHIRSYTELATGMHYKGGDGQWLESKEEIEILPDGAGAKAEQGQHKVIFPANINEGLIEMNTPDNKWLRSSVLGLGYFDTSTGESVLIAEVKDSVGELHGKNVVLYADAFTDVRADVHYTYRLSGFEQDIILREQPPSPAEFGLNPQTTRLQVLTEFFDPPQPVKREQIVRDASGTEMTDEALDFGVMQMAQGKAFSLEACAEIIPVTKLWLELDGRDFLIEEVEVQAVEKELEVLPKAGGASLQPRTNAVKQARVGTPALPVRRQAKSGSHPMRMAQAAASSRGFVLDYITLIGSQTNLTFKGDTTYYISGSFGSTRTNTFEGGAVIKYATNATLNITPGSTGSPVIRWLAGAYRPVVFSAKDDNSVGETISGSTGNPTGYYGNPMLSIVAPASPPMLTGFRMAYAQKGVGLVGGTFGFYDAQFVNCQKGLSASGGVTVYLRNALFANTRTNLEVMNGSGLSAQNVTFSGSSLLAVGSPTYPDSNLRLTNCIIANVTNLFSGVFGATNANFNGFYQSPNVGGNTFTNTFYPFQTVGAGHYYLTNGCGFTNTGTTNIDAILLASLKKKTTHPPMVFSNATINVPTNFDIHAQRDTDTPDLGYHYDPMDYVFGGCDVNTNVTFAAGTAVGWFRTSSGWEHAGHGIHIGDRQTVTFDGTAEAPCWWVRANTVQEQGGNTIWQGGFGPGGMTSWADQDGPYTNAAIVKARFLKCSSLSGDIGNHFRDDWGILIGHFRDSEFYNAGVAGYVSTYYFSNCLFYRASAGGINEGRAGNEFVARNCTWYGGHLYLTPTMGIPIVVNNCSLDGTDITTTGYAANPSYANYDYNAYTNASNPFPFGSNHKSSVNFNWQTGPLGQFYLPSDSDLINAGSTNANLLGLYHYTTQTNQVTDGASTVDIGYHYVATTASSQPLDMDEDTIPDYLDDDADGDFLPDVWEIANGMNPLDPEDAQVDEDGDGLNAVAEYYFGTDRFDPDTDYDGRSDYEEMTEQTDPLVATNALGVQLGFWSFDDTNGWTGAYEQPSLGFTNISGVPSWSGVALRVNSAYPAYLKYRDVETNGTANINCRNGTVRFWFRPEWSSTTTNNGSGPQNAARLIEVGSYSASGWWALLLNTNGTQIFLVTRTNGVTTTNLTATVNWSSNNWQQIALTYSPSNSSLYINGAVVEIGGGGITAYPNRAIRSFGFCVGSDATGNNQSRGRFENLETFNVPLDETAVADAYQAAMQTDTDEDGLPDILEDELGTDPNNPDTDGDGISDYDEVHIHGTNPLDSDSDGDGLLDKYELDNGLNPAAWTDPLGDPDYDGRNNLQEQADGTNPLSSSSVAPVRLGHWRFNNTNTWAGDQGQLPLQAANVHGVSSWSGHAAKMGDANPTVLRYRDVETNGLANINCREGSVSFWFRPAWNSGTGPGSSARLIEVGDSASANGWWTLRLNATGTQLEFLTKSNSAPVSHFTCSIDWQSNEWHQIVLNYSPDATVLYTNGSWAADGSGIGEYPNQAGRAAYGFSLGGDHSGQARAGGQFEELETFNYSYAWPNYYTMMNPEFVWAGYDNDHVNFTNFTFTLEGEPTAQMAVLVDTNDFNLAVWLPFGTNALAQLPPQDGSHRVWYGLKGIGGATLWNSFDVVLDRVAPVLVITNPAAAASTTSRPWLQLKGYGNEDLFGLYYAMTNAAGILTNEQGFVTGRHFDTNTFNYTVNDFQFYDIELTNGVNLITLHVSDLAGNVTVTNLTVTLDYSGDTNGPVIQVVWPWDGANLSGDTFTLRGLLDDETASAWARIVGTNGVTNVVEGIVERDGRLWIEELPLAAGSNDVTVTAMDAAGNWATTNLSVFKSEVTLTVDWVDEGNLYNVNTTIGGTISDISYELWANGVQVTSVDEYGNWQATVPVIGKGTATFDVTAYPPGGGGGGGEGGGEGGGSGGGGGGGSGGGTILASKDVEMPAIIRLVEYRSEGEDSHATAIPASWNKRTFGRTYHARVSPDENGDYRQTYDVEVVRKYQDPTINGTITFRWSSGDPVGTYERQWSGSGGSGSDSGVMLWVFGSEFDLHPVGPTPDQELDGGLTIGQSKRYITHHSAQGVLYAYSDAAGDTQVYQLTATPRLEFHTGGGKGRKGRKVLFSIGLSGEEYGRPENGAWTYTPWRYLTPTKMKALGETFDKEGRIYTVRPLGESFDATVRGAKHFAAELEPTAHKLVVVANGIELSDSEVVSDARFAVGMKIELGTRFVPPFAGVVTEEQVSWGIQGKYVNAFDVWMAPPPFMGPYQRVAIKLKNREHMYDYAWGLQDFRADNSWLQREPTRAWWLTGKTDGYEEKRISVGKYVKFKDGREVHLNAWALLGMHQPSIEADVYIPGVVHGRRIGSLYQCRVGSYAGDGTDFQGFQVKCRSLHSGLFGITQLLIRDSAVENWNNWRLDNSFPYQEGTFGIADPVTGIRLAVEAFTDGPGCVIGGYQHDQFKQYWHYRPDGAESIRVTLGISTWEWEGRMSGCPTCPEGWKWTTQPYCTPQSENLTESDELPEWKYRKFNF